MLICALPWLSALCCLVLLLCFCFCPANRHFFVLVCVILFLLHACHCLHLALIAQKKKKQTKKTQTNQTQCGAHKSASLNILVAVDDLLSAPVPSLACCDWWLRCLTWAVLCGWSSSPKYGLLADRYHFCEKCFNEIQGESVSLGDDPSQPQT